MMRKVAWLLAAGVAVLALAGSMAEGASAGHGSQYSHFFSGNLTENYHNSNCYYSIGSACSNFHNPTWLQAWPDWTNGSNLVAFDNGSVIRGDFTSQAGYAAFVYNWECECGSYLRASFTIWSATFTDVGDAYTCVVAVQC